MCIVCIVVLYPIIPAGKRKTWRVKNDNDNSKYMSEQVLGHVAQSKFKKPSKKLSVLKLQKKLTHETYH